jgi:acetyl esterase
VLVGAPPAVGSVAQRWIPGPGGPLAIRIYRPAGALKPPAFIYLHGGGWVIGSLEGADAVCRRLVNATECAVFSVDYRLAPEHKYPAALDDAFAAVEWVVAAADELGVDATRLVVGGSSAGANLAAAMSLRARDRGRPPIALQVLLVPPLWMAIDATESMRVNARGYGLDASTMRWFAEHYVRSPEDANDPLVSPYLASDLGHLPPAVIVTAEYDPLRDDGELYAGRLRTSGVEATVLRYAGMIHVLMGLPGADARAADIGALVRAHLADASAPLEATPVR